VNAKITTAKDRNVAQNERHRGPTKGRRARFTAFVSGPLFLFAVGLSVILNDADQLTLIVCDGVDDDVEDLSLCLLPTDAVKDFSKQHAKGLKRNVSEAIGSKAPPPLSVTARSRLGPHDQDLVPLKHLPSAERRAPKTPSTDPD
jgi:hypothetical protein